MRHTAICKNSHRSLFLFSALTSALLCCTNAAAAAGTRAEREPICPFPEQLSTAKESDSAADETENERHPGISFHKIGAHDLYDDHNYTTERHWADRFSGEMP